MSDWLVSGRGDKASKPTRGYNGETVRLSQGSPMVFEPLKVSGRQMRYPRAGVMLSAFAGVLLRDIEYVVGAGDASNSALAEQGTCPANLYIPTAAQIAAGTLFAAATPGAHLLPNYIASLGVFLTPCVFNTGIILLDDKSASAEGTVLDVTVDGGAQVEIRRGDHTNPIEHLLYVQPAAAAATAYHDGLATSASETTSYVAADLTLATMDVPRNLVVTPTGTAADVKAGDVVIVGTDIWGNVITENFTLTVNALTAATGSKAFATITSVTIPAQDGADVAIDIGSGVKLGLGRPYAVAPVYVAGRNNSAAEGGAPTIAIDADAVEGNTITFNTAPNGAKTLEAWLLSA